MKRTSMVIDEKLIKEGMEATGIKTCRALVDLCPAGTSLSGIPQKDFRVKREGAETSRGL